ncbi:MAG: hypothetical protein ACLT1W_15085, partial [Alistipes onderdonkii]
YETNSAGESDEASPVFPFAENYSDITSKYVECADVDVRVRERIDGESGLTCAAMSRRRLRGVLSLRPGSRATEKRHSPTWA